MQGRHGSVPGVSASKGRQYQTGLSFPQHPGTQGHILQLACFLQHQTLSWFSRGTKALGSQGLFKGEIHSLCWQMEIEMMLKMAHNREKEPLGGEKGGTEWNPKS